MDQKELLNQIINHKMLQKVMEAERDTLHNDYHIFSRLQIQEILSAKHNPATELLLMAMRAQIAEEEDRFRNTLEV